MLRTRQSLVRFAAVGVLASALALGAATPAFAFGPPDVTVTPTTTGEDPLTTVAVVCPVTSTSVNISWSGIDGGAAASYGPTPQALDGAGEYSDGYFLESFFDRDTDATVSIDCLDAGLVSTGTDSLVYHLPTTGATLSTAASRGVNQDVIATGNCGTMTNVDQITVDAYQYPAATQIAGFPTVVAYTNAANFSVNLGTGAALSVPVGDSIRVFVSCRSTVPANHTTSNRNSTTLMTLAVTAPAGGPALAATGSDLSAPAMAAGSLLLAGTALLLIRRRRAQRG